MKGVQGKHKGVMLLSAEDGEKTGGEEVWVPEEKRAGVALEDREKSCAGAGKQGRRGTALGASYGISGGTRWRLFTHRCGNRAPASEAWTTFPEQAW